MVEATEYVIYTMMPQHIRVFWVKIVVVSHDFLLNEWICLFERTFIMSRNQLNQKFKLILKEYHILYTLQHPLQQPF